MRLSYSRLSMFIKCGLLYRLRYVEKVPARPKPHLGFGRILHSTLGKFYMLDTNSPTLDDLLYIYDEFWETGSNTYKRYYARGVGILRRYYALNARDYYKAIYVEQPFEIPLGEHTLGGRFDRVDQIGDDAYEVIDYKVSSHVPGQTEINSDPQLGIYALAFKLATGKLPIVSFYFLPRNIKVTSERTEGEILRIKAMLDEIVTKMMSGEHFEPREGVECKWCDYKRYCPLKTKNPIEIPERQFQPELTL